MTKFRMKPEQESVVTALLAGRAVNNNNNNNNNSNNNNNNIIKFIVHKTSKSYNTLISKNEFQ